ncbi:LynF/TruF/PatF family peptide O-prenyltransferase [Floridanema evergladense]|uniref:LynF/TruF/PatF family peptide O-prenyltransferase n=1 Tax=Floridaenema evergladense BLCC-F167 TaxID=3153639 RepID=A0ABV4WLX0_9CYAN
MITSDNIFIGSQKNLYYINQHKQVFDVDYLYPLDIFEQFVQEQATNWGLECSCKIEKDKLYPARFNLFRNQPTSQHYQAAIHFFEQAESRADVKINYRLIQQFVGNDFNFSKVVQILVGVDLRKEFSASRLKFWFVIKDYPQKLATAISLCHPPKELEMLLIDDSVVIGFDFDFKGGTEIEVYPKINEEKFKQFDVQNKLKKVLSPKALQLLDNCWSLIIGFSQANPEKILYYRTNDPNNFIANLHNDLANRVHAYYRKQPVHGTIVGLREQELLVGKIENLNLYYQMSKSD